MVPFCRIHHKSAALRDPVGLQTPEPSVLLSPSNVISVGIEANGRYQ